ncbi:hypothetical protein ANN_24724 [Periplaneta americana]|uniref:Tc1-like transposase DDE domain-containing protein n=1 Tax=Periplaneta americana TaxID=6978 RepID=A0ABQ8RZF4_PERAM|nr:hypothetical protein ANN_24724 [Periplaneta americana]
MEEHGHSVLRLPPYHPDLNPLEMIWADAKQWVANRNTTFKIADVMALCRQSFEEIRVDKWKNVCRHSEKVKSDYFEMEGLVEDAIERIAFTVNNSSDTNDSESEDGEDGGIEELE